VPIIQDEICNKVISLEETLEYFSSIDISDHDELLGGAPTLRALANNRTFLARLIAEELKHVDSLQKGNQYSAQVFALGESRNFFMRANFWPAAHDSMFQASGAKPFFYDVPHDHNFDFLTVGYYGPGYLSDFYEYNFDDVVGYVGEVINLRYIGREALSQGRTMLYRASVDIHNQLPPESFSISINVMTNFPEQIAGVNQYMLDLPSGMITSLGNRASLPLLCEVAAEIGDEECIDVLDYLRATHPSPRGRVAAYAALARLRRGEAHHIWADAVSDPEKHVSVQARIRLARLEGDPAIT